MGTTSNYSWPTPEATDLVKDGWDAIKDLGDAADTTVKAVSDAQGLVLISSTTSGSGVSSFSVEDVFSADYKNYKIVLSDCTASATGDIRMRLRVSGSDNSTNNYFNQRMIAGGTNVTAVRATETSFEIGAANVEFSSIIIEVFNPFETKNTLLNIVNTFSGSSSSVAARYFANGIGLTDSFTGFTIYPGSGTITFGDVKVYGYK